MMKKSDSVSFKGKNGGSGWTRTTDLTLISRSFISLNLIFIRFYRLTVQSTVQNNPTISNLLLKVIEQLSTCYIFNKKTYIE